MLIVAIKMLAVFSLFIVIIQYFIYATSRRNPAERKRASLPMGIILFVLAIAGFASRDKYLAFLSVILVGLSLWLGPTTWRGKEPDHRPEP